MAYFGVLFWLKAGFQHVIGTTQESGRPVMAELINIPSTKLLINKLLAAVHNQIELNSENFNKFIKILKDYKQLKDLIKLLECKWTQYRH